MTAKITELRSKLSSKEKKRRRKLDMSELPGYKQHLKSHEMKNVSYRETSVTLDKDSGELLEQKYTTVTKAKDDDFIKLYLADIGYLHRLEHNQQELLYYFLKRMGYDNLIPMYKPIKEIIAKESGKALSTINNALSAFVETGILLRQGRGLYLANPYLFGRGKFEEIEKIRMELIYTSDGIKLRSQIDRGDGFTHEQELNQTSPTN